MVNKGEIPFVRLLVPLIAGIISGKYFPVSFPVEYLALTLIFIFTAVASGVFFYKPARLYLKRWLPGLAVHVLVFALAYQLTLHESDRFKSDNFAVLRGSALAISVDSEPVIRNDRIRFESQVRYVLNNTQALPSTGRLLVALNKRGSDRVVRYGDLLLIPYRFTEVKPPHNPGEFDYKGFLANKKIYYQTFTDQHQTVLLERGTGNPVIAYALALRQKLVKRFNDHISNKDAAAVASTLILGYRADLSHDIIDAYSKTGTMHVLSVSGMHVGLVYLVLSWILHGAGKRKQLRYIEPVLVIPLIWFYALITGFSPSVCRAVLMLTFYVAGKSLNRSHNSYNLVAISAFFLLIYNPYYLFDVGFQLSYLAVTGLICLHPKIYHLLYLKNKLTDKIWSYTALSIAAQLATFPLSIYYFHQFPVYFLLSNLFIALPVSAIMYAGFAFLLVPVDAIADVSGSVLSYMITSVNAILSYIENIPFSTIDDLWVSVLEFVLLYVMIGTFIAAFQLRSKKILMAGICCVLILITSFTRRSIQNKSRHELIFYSLHKNMAIGYLKNGRGSIITDLVKGDKALTYSIYPVMSGGGVRRQTLYHDSVRISGISNRHFYKFGDFKILKWNGTADLTAFNYPIEVDAVLLTSDPRINIRELKERIRFSILLIDGTNPDYRVSRWQADARQLGVKYYILKNNPALIVDLSG